MKIAINLRLLSPGKIGGQEGYVRNIIQYLLSAEDVTLLLFVTKENTNTFPSESNVEKVLLPRENYGKVIFDNIVEKKVELYFCPLMVLEPVIVHIPTVINIPDIQHDFLPNFFSNETLAWRNLHYKSSVANADLTLTVSKFSQSTILEQYKVSTDKVACTYLAGHNIFRETCNESLKDVIKQKYRLPDIFGYFPANTWPHKNHNTLLQALRLYNATHAVPLKLVLTGAEDTGHKSLLKLIENYGLTDCIFFLGYVPLEEVPYIYRNASFLIFPSLFEGFGMPVIEAMLSECPVICSNSTSLPEVTGEAALLFDPQSPEDIAEKIHHVLTDPDLRNNLIQQGLKQALKFSWQNTGEQTLNLFKKVVQRPSPSLKATPLVSIVTPSYNQGCFIEETILSIIGQDYPNLEHIVMDGGSKDETVEILKKYSSHIKWESEADNGQADAVNKGFRIAKGTILGWLNSDDTYLPGALTKVVKYFQSHPETVMVYGNAYYTDKDSIITDSYATESYDANRLAETCYICQPSVFLRAEALTEVGELNVSLRTCMDFELWIRFSKQFRGRIGFLDDYLATSRMYQENKTLSLRKTVYDEIIETVTRHFGYVADSWMYGYIDDVISGVLIKRLKPYQRPFKHFFYWYYVTELALHLRSLLPFSAARYLLKKPPQTTHCLYPDGWVSDYCVIPVIKANSQDTIKLVGRNISPFIDPLSVQVTINYTFVFDLSIPKGDYVSEIRLPKALLFENKLELRIKSNQTFIPKDLGINEDTRTLSFIIDKIQTTASGTKL